MRIPIQTQYVKLSELRDKQGDSTVWLLYLSNVTKLDNILEVWQAYFTALPASFTQMKPSLIVCWGISKTEFLFPTSLSKSKDFDRIVPSIFDLMNHKYLSSWGHSRFVITNKKI